MKKFLWSSLLFVVVFSLSVVAAAKGYEKIDPNKCTNCVACVQVCPVEAISKAKVNGKEVQVIDPAKCTDCGACVSVCPEGAISHVKVAPAAPAKQPAKK